MKHLLLVSYIMALCLLIPSTILSQIILETEPNNDLVSANRISGESIVLGELKSGDNDRFEWVISDVDASFKFRVWLLPPLNAESCIRIKNYGPEEPDLPSTLILSLSSSDGMRPIVSPELILDPGRYEISIESTNGDGGYCLKLEKTDALITGKNVISADDSDIDLPLQEVKETAYYVETERFGFTWSSQHPAGKKWRLRTQINAGRKLSLDILDMKGQLLRSLKSSDMGFIDFENFTSSGNQLKLNFTLNKNTGSIFCIKLEEDGSPAVDSEIEPNNEVSCANIMDLSSVMTGTIASEKDTDCYRFRITTETTSRKTNLKLVSTSSQSIQLCLFDSKNRVLLCREGPAPLQICELSLEPGDYWISTGRSRSNVPYEIEFTETGMRKPGSEIEPDDTVLDALNAGQGGVFESRFEGRDTDYYGFLCLGEPQLWRIEIFGEGIGELILYDSAVKPIKEVQVAYGTPNAAIANVLLFPGLHYISVRGHESAYQLNIIPLGLPKAGSEIEPNDDSSRSLGLKFDQIQSGIIAEPSDKDLYRFFLAQEDHIRLTIRTSGTEGLRTLLFWDGRKIKQRISTSPEDPTIIEGVYPPGDYEIELWAREPMTKDYTIRLERLERYDVKSDREPNDIPAQAAPIPEKLIVEGSVGDFDGDVDYYQLPSFSEEREIIVDNPENIWLFLESADGGKPVRLEKSSADNSFTGRIAPESNTFLKIDGHGRYTCSIRFTPEWKPEKSDEPSSLTMNLDFKTLQIAAFYENSQRFSGSIELRNPDLVECNVELTVFFSQFGWTAETNPSVVHIDAGQKSTASIEVLAPDNVGSDRPVKLTILAESPDGRSVSASVDVSADIEILPLNPCQSRLVPESLRGGLNLAASVFGAKLIQPGGSNPAQLFDRMTPLHEGFTLRNIDKNYMPVIQLAGDGDHRIAGFALNPQGKTTASEMLRDFEISVSSDGASFETVLSDRLAPLPQEQFFVLPQPVAAKYARLRLINSQVGSAADAIGLGEWKVIGVPGQNLLKETRINLADPRYGGHVVWSDPQISSEWDKIILTPEVESSVVKVPSGRIAQWVIGFEHERTAKISDLEWIDTSVEGSEDRFKKIILSVSTTSSTGPWTAIGSWDLSQMKSSASTFELNEPVWARYIKFSDASATPNDTNRRYPASIRIYEEQMGINYLSILGEWGHYVSVSMYENLQEIKSPESINPSISGTIEKAQNLIPGQRVSGKVMLGKREEWHRVEIPSSDNTLRLTVSGDPDVRVQVDVQTKEGRAIEAAEPERRPGTLEYSFPVKPGESYWARVSEPQRSVIFAWDTSNSVAPYLPVIYSALSQFVEDITPNVEVVNLLPFGGKLLLDHWSDQPLLLRTVLNLYERGDFSSSAEYTLRRASEALAGRKGTKAVVLVTDGATPRDPILWKILDEIQPKVFSLAISSGGNMHPNPPQEQDLMQSWAHVNGGFYEYLRTQGEMEHAFQRASAQLRKPAFYSLIATTEQQPEPDPGSLLLKTSPLYRPAGAVELILDASGSMLQKMGSERRIEIAKKVLADVIEKQLPEGMPVALRVFGTREANACTTDLVMPLQPLDSAKMKHALSGLTAKNLSKTPIADSLKLIVYDLENVKGRRLVILVTDGEETCGGNPVEAIQSIQSQGVDICLNIVGLGVSETEISFQFREWAETGRGRYFDADETESLKNSVTQALQIPYTVMDDGGSIIALGTVNGPPVVIPAGIYRVEVRSDPPKTYESVKILSMKGTELTIQ